MSEAKVTLPVPSPEQAAEVYAERRPVPVWLIFLFFVLLYWAMVHFDEHSGWFSPQVYAPYTSVAELQVYQPAAGGSKDRGKFVYESLAQCVLCHNTDGTGKPGQAPPLAKSEWVLGSPNRVIRIPLAGLTGPITILGQEWNLSMPAMGASLSDEDLAAVLTYIRQTWGNNASEVTPEQVKAVRAQVGNRTQPWTSAELQSVQ